MERLRFISRAKQLGCSLDEIADLTRVWDGGRCATVQDHLRATVEAKIADAHSQIAALTTLAAHFKTTAATSTGAPMDDPCDDKCACNSGTAKASTAHTSVPLLAESDADPTGSVDEIPIACTLGAGEMATRLDEWNALLAAKQDLLRGVVARRALDGGGLRLEFGAASDVSEIARLAAAEQGCCRFFDFALTIDDRGIALEVHVPPDAQPVLTALFGVVIFTVFAVLDRAVVGRWYGRVAR